MGCNPTVCQIRYTHTHTLGYYSAMKRNQVLIHVHIPWKHYTKGEKPEAEEQILHDSIYMKYLERANWQICKDRK